MAKSKGAADSKTNAKASKSGHKNKDDLKPHGPETSTPKSNKGKASDANEQVYEPEWKTNGKDLSDVPTRTKDKLMRSMQKAEESNPAIEKWEPRSAAARSNTRSNGVLTSSQWYRVPQIDHRPNGESQGRHHG